MENRISIITLGVMDFQRSLTFYRDGLGLPVKHLFEHAAFFEYSRSTQLALYPRELLAEDATVSGQGNGFPGFTLAQCVRSKDAVRDLLSEAKAAGATIVKEAQDVFWGGYSGYFSDPDGFLWEVAWNPEFTIE